MRRGVLLGALLACLGCEATPAGTDGGGGGGSGAGGAGGGGGGSLDGGQGGGVPTTTLETFGPTHAGSYHLGPVDWAESVWTNSCGPYPAAVQQLEGVFLAGVDNAHNADGSLCDACALVTTRLGRSRLVRIITTGVSKAQGDLDLSPEAFEALHLVDPQGTPANPRPMTWQLAKCAAGANIHLQFQTQANPWWTSFWVRNPRLPVARVEVQSARHPTFTALRRETDGTWNDDSGFGEGAFTVRLIGPGGEVVSQRFDGFTAGALVPTAMQFE